MSDVEVVVGAGWLPWSQREAQRPVSVPSREVEAHMRVVLGSWIRDRLEGLYRSDSGASGLVALLGSRLEWSGIKHSADYLERAQQDTAGYFDAIEMLLRVPPPRYGWPRGAASSDLELALEMAGSAWTVGPDGARLTLRVDDTAVKQVTEAAAVSDSARADLVEAWNAAFGRHPNASDAWDHSIKAVEHIYSPLVLQRQADNDQSTLGMVANELRDNRKGWVAEIATERGDPTSGVAVIEALIRTVWGNTDRHGGGPSWRAPQLPETQAIVHAAITLVQWGRQGVLRKVAR